MPVYSVVLRHLMASHAREFKLLRDACLTFHINDDMGWLSPHFIDYFRFEWEQGARTLEQSREAGATLTPAAIGMLGHFYQMIKFYDETIHTPRGDQTIFDMLLKRWIGNARSTGVLTQDLEKLWRPDILTKK